MQVLEEVEVAVMYEVMLQPLDCLTGLARLRSSCPSQTWAVIGCRHSPPPPTSIRERLELAGRVPSPSRPSH